MPELPEVEQFKRYFVETSLHQHIRKVIVNHPMVLDQVSPSDLQTQLQGGEFTIVQRHGKYLFAKSNDVWLTLHFGMSGYLVYLHDNDETPPHDRVLFQFSNASSLVFNCQRMFGRVSLADSIEHFLQHKHLGPDALEIDFDTFYDQLHHRRGILKSSLMNQQILAGIGNLYADEILFQTGFHPATKTNTLTDAQFEAMFDAMKEILHTAVAVAADFKQYPSTYLLPHRVKGGKCPRDQTPLTLLKLAGRTAYYCPKHQKKSV